MKNKLSIPIALLALITWIAQVPLLAQATDPAVQTEQKESLQKRSQTSPEAAPGNQNQVNERDRPHRGGKQSFRGRSFQQDGINHRGFRNFRYNHPGNTYGGFRNRGYGQQFRSYQFRHRGFGYDQFRSGRFNQHRPGMRPQHGRNTPFNARQKTELKTLKDQIWKDGVMDLKEKDAIRDKMKSFRSTSPNKPHKKDRDTFQRKPNQKK